MKLENIDIEYAIYGMLFSLSNRIQTIGDKEFNDITVKQHFVLIEDLCVVHCFGLKSMLCRKEVGLRFGLAFALLYMIGMQEVVVSASPFDTYGMDFIFYQLFMGLILEGMMFKMFLRSGVDVIVIFSAIWFLEHKYMMLQKE